jgi:1-deoxy-D-xylulose-5-phosphate reductoisomerase
VISRNKDKFNVFALVAGQNVALMKSQCETFKPKYVVMQSQHAANQLAEAISHSETIVLNGTQAMQDIASHSDVDIVMSAIVGAAGLLPTISAVEHGKKVLLANKESLVMSGQLFMDKVKQHKATLLPIDSEHNAIYQSLPTAFQQHNDPQLPDYGVSKILLTGSGGPFLNRDIDTLEHVTVDEAVAHPNWSMGQKISVDSATMMNKGLEFIEAKWLFNCDAQDIDVVIHPQSMIHSMVQYKDGSVIAQLGQPDMRTPIAYGLSYPERIDAGVETLDFSKICDFTFTKPDYNRYPNLSLAIEACRMGQAATTAVNAANEIAVAAFLNKKIRFTDIYKVNAEVLNQIAVTNLLNIDDVLAQDSEARSLAKSILEAME